MKVLWKPPGRLYESFGFPKNSPLLPFFNLAYKQLRETGSWIRIHKKWISRVKLECQKDRIFAEPIIIEKLASLFAMFAMGLLLASGILAVEKLYQKFSKTSDNEKLISHTEKDR